MTVPGFFGFFLAELTQHIPNKGEHLIRYFGHYSNKARGMRARQAQDRSMGVSPAEDPASPPPALSRSKGRRWAILIRRVYQADPLRCPRCGGTMKIISFIEAHQRSVIRKILQHCGLWQDPPLRGPPKRAHPPPGPALGRQGSLFDERGDSDSQVTHEVDPDFLEFLRREDIDEPEPAWEP